MKMFKTSVLGMGMACLIAGQAMAAEPDISKFVKVKDTVHDKCMVCHTKGLDLPFYAKVPGIRQMIEKDYRDGLRAMDLGMELVGKNASKPVGETVLAKMEYVITNDTMPPAKFAVVHWGSRLSDADKKNILEWVKENRAAHYAAKDVAPKFANEPVQPLPISLNVDQKKADLGDKLFNDKRISTDSTLSCAGCHDPAKGGTDNRRFSLGVKKDGKDQEGDVNAPTTFNAAFNMAQFWDGRAADLQEQAGGPPLNPIEMGSKDWNEIIGRLSKDAALTAEIKAIYPDGWTDKNITNAIAEYEKTLISPNSRFDQWLRGKEGAITPVEAEGYKLFKNYRCASCHVGKSLGGQSYEFLDLKKDYFAERKRQALGSDKGRASQTKNDADLHRFKVPNLRNIELTYPYMHDGTVETLDEAVEVMGEYCAGMPVPEGHRKLIVGFLRTLTGEHHKLGGKPVLK